MKKIRKCKLCENRMHEEIRHYLSPGEVIFREIIFVCKPCHYLISKNLTKRARWFLRERMGYDAYTEFLKKLVNYEKKEVC